MIYKHNENTLLSLRAYYLTQCKPTQPAADRHQDIRLLVILALQAV